MYSCIADAYDDKLVAIARGKRPDIVEVIHKVMDGEHVETGCSFQGTAGLREDRQSDPGPHALLGFVAGAVKRRAHGA